MSEEESFKVKVKVPDNPPAYLSTLDLEGIDLCNDCKSKLIAKFIETFQNLKKDLTYKD